jgi:hypothetical protein
MMRLLYRTALLLTPPDFRGAFGTAMVEDFTRRSREARTRGHGAAMRLITEETLSLVRCAASEWVAKIAAPPFQREMIFHDRSRMRPPCATKTFWYDL